MSIRNTINAILTILAVFLAASAAHALPLDYEPPSGMARSAMGALSDVPCVDGMAGNFHCHGVDLLSYLPLSDMGCGTRGNDIWGWTDPVTGTEYALMGCNNGTSFVDLSDPEDSVYIGFLPTHTSNSSWRDIKVYADHAYVVSEASGHGLQVFDLTQLRDVISPPEIFANTAHLGGFGQAHNVAINEDSGFAYVVGAGRNNPDTCFGGLFMVNIQQPANPSFAGCFGDDGYTHDTQCVIYHGPDENYQGDEICFNSNENTLTIADVTDKNNPVMLGRETYPGVAYAHQGWLTEDHQYFLLDDELDESSNGHNTRTYIWEVSDLMEPEFIGFYESPTESAIDHNQYIKGNHTYQSNYTSGLRILELTDLAAGILTEVAYFNVIPHAHDHGPGLRHDDLGGAFNGTWSNYPFFDSGIVIVSTIGEGNTPGGLFVVRPHLVESVIEGTVTRSDTGEPLDDVLVEVAAGLPHEAVTGGDGTWSMDILPGTYTVTASKPGFVPASEAGVVVMEGTPATVDLELDPAPIAHISPEAFSFEVPQNGTGSQQLTIGNTGNGDLVWEIDTDVPESVGAHLDFEGHFAIGNWTLENNPAGTGGGFDTNPGPPIELFVEGGDAGTQGDTDFRIDIPANGTVHFDWGYQSTDSGDWDSGGYVINGGYTQLADNASQVPYFNEHVQVPVSAGDNFAFRVHTRDGNQGPGILGVTGFRFELDACNENTNAPWLSANPDSGGVPAGGIGEITVEVNAAGLEEGEYEAYLCVTTNDPDAALVPVPVQLTVTGPVPGELELTPASFDYGEVTVGSTGLGELNLTNVAGEGASSVLVSAILVTGSGAVFVDTANGTCEPGVTELAPDHSCTMEVAFTPLNPTAYAGSVVVDGADGKLASATLSGSGIEPEPNPGILAVEPGELDFGQQVTFSDTDLTFTVSNAAEEPAESIVIHGIVEIADFPGSTYYSDSSQNCQFDIQELAPGDECVVGIRFRPEEAVSYSGSAIVHTSVGQSDAVALLGEGIAPAAEFSEESFEFELELGGSASQVLVITNSGDAPLTWRIEPSTTTICAWATPPSWLEADPWYGQTGSGDSVEINLTVDGSELPIGIRGAWLCFESNDPDNRYTRIPVTVTVTGPPEIFRDRFEEN